MSYVFELPTTGSFSFAECYSDPTNVYTSNIAEATQARANLRALLKESKRTDGEKDYLRLIKILVEYIPQLFAVANCVASGDIVCAKEPGTSAVQFSRAYLTFMQVFSWRTTLSSQLFNNSPRLSLPRLPSELAFTLLTYGFALSNLARTSVVTLGQYEYERGISDVERKAKDEKLGFAINLLCKASAVFAYVGDEILVEAEKTPGWLHGISRPPELSQEVASALSKMSLASAQSLAIRKLLTKAAFDSTVSPGPPLPKSHPSPSLVAKLHLECAALASSALSLARMPGASKARVRSPTGKAKLALPFGRERSPGQDARGEMEVTADVLRALADTAAFHTALAHKWLGVDAGERDLAARGGEAVGFLAWAKKALEELKDEGKVGNREEGREGRRGRRERVLEELESVGVYLKHYKKLNDSLAFQSVPSQAALQASIPAGRLAVATKPYEKPTPAFGPGSVAYLRKQAEQLDLDADSPHDDGSDVVSPKDGRSYAGEGSYF